MLKTIDDFAPEGVESGASLILRDEDGRYLFFLAGTRHRHQCPPGQLFYAGIGGHRELGEAWPDCVRREAAEEIGSAVDIESSAVTWYVPHHGEIERARIRDRPRPLALYEMIHPPRTPAAGGLYRIVIYEGRLRTPPIIRLPDEVRGVIGLTEDQVVLGPQRRPTLAQLLDEGARVLAGEGPEDLEFQLYPIGTAAALSRLLLHVKERPRSAPDERRQT